MQFPKRVQYVTLQVQLEWEKIRTVLRRLRLSGHFERRSRNLTSLPPTEMRRIKILCRMAIAELVANLLTFYKQFSQLGDTRPSATSSCWSSLSENIYIMSRVISQISQCKYLVLKIHDHFYWSRSTKFLRILSRNQLRFTHCWGKFGTQILSVAALVSAASANQLISSISSSAASVHQQHL